VQSAELSDDGATVSFPRAWRFASPSRTVTQPNRRARMPHVRPCLMIRCPTFRAPRRRPPRGSLRAHDPSESWTEVIVHADKMEMFVTMRSHGAEAHRPAKKIPQLTRKTSRNIVCVFCRSATLFAITSLKTKLASRSIDVELTDEGDVAYKIIFPCRAGLLMLDAAFMKKLGDGSRHHRRGRRSRPPTRLDQLTNENTRSS